MLPHLQQGMGWHQQIPIFFSLEQEQLPPISTATSSLLSFGSGLRRWHVEGSHVEELTFSRHLLWTRPVLGNWHTLF